MPTASSDLLAVYVDGETKTGKGSASKAIAASLEQENVKVYYDIAGDFYRRYVALVRQHLGLDEHDSLPVGPVLQTAAKAVYDTKQPYEPNDKLGDLQRPAISQSVSVLGELPLAQQAGAQWWAMTLQMAKEAGAEVLVVDGRNPRNRVHDASAKTGIEVRTALDLYMTCDATEAGRRTLRLEGITAPTEVQLAAAAQKVAQRRSRDRERPDHPFVVPSFTLAYDPTRMTATEMIQQSWHAPGIEPPATITIDNTSFTEQQMITAVQELARSAISFVFPN